MSLSKERQVIMRKRNAQKRKISGELGRMLRVARGHNSILAWSELLSINKNTLGAYERAASLPDLEFLATFSEISDKNFLTLLIGRLISSPDPAANRLGRWLEDIRGGVEEKDDCIRVGGLPSALSMAGAGATVKEVLLGRQYLATLGFANPSAAAFFVVPDDAMAPTLAQGNIVLVDRAATVVGNGIYVVSVDGMVMCKRLQVVPRQGVRVLSDNPHYEPFTVARGAASGRFRILGRAAAVWSGRHF